MEIKIKEHKPELVWILFVVDFFFCFYPNKTVAGISIIFLVILIIHEIRYKIPEKLLFEKGSIQIFTTDYLGLNKNHKRYATNHLEYYFGKVPHYNGVHYGIRIYLIRGKKIKRLIEINEDDTSIEELKKIRDELKRVVGESRKTC